MEVLGSSTLEEGVGWKNRTSEQKKGGGTARKVNTAETEERGRTVRLFRDEQPLEGSKDGRIEHQNERRVEVPLGR
jgi:hypothetical protein